MRLVVVEVLDIQLDLVVQEVQVFQLSQEVLIKTMQEEQDHHILATEVEEHLEEAQHL